MSGAETTTDLLHEAGDPADVQASVALNGNDELVEHL